MVRGMRKIFYGISGWRLQGSRGRRLRFMRVEFSSWKGKCDVLVKDLGGKEGGRRGNRRGGKIEEVVHGENFRDRTIEGDDSRLGGAELRFGNERSSKEKKQQEEGSRLKKGLGG